MHIQRHTHTSTHVQLAHNRNGDNQAQEPGWEGRKKGFVRDLARTHTQKMSKKKNRYSRILRKDSSTANFYLKHYKLVGSVQGRLINSVCMSFCFIDSKVRKIVFQCFWLVRNWAVFRWLVVFLEFQQGYDHKEIENPYDEALLEWPPNGTPIPMRVMDLRD